MNNYEKAYIFFDTNSLECRHSGNSLFLSRITISPLYYEIERLILDFNLKEKIQICIPEIVWLEIKEHLRSHFKSEKDSIHNKIKSCKKSFGDLIEFTCDFKEFNDFSNFENHLIAITDDFINNSNITNIIPYPRDEATIATLVNKAVCSINPFRKASSGGKRYTDAGFKDALLLDTVFQHTGNQLGILITNDQDFDISYIENSKPNIRICNRAKEVEYILTEAFNIVTQTRIEAQLKDNKYLIERILTETNINSNSSYKFNNLVFYKNTNEGVSIRFTAVVENEKYMFNILYNMDAQELLSASYDTDEEMEETENET